MIELSNHRHRRYTDQFQHDNILHEHESKSVKEPTDAKKTLTMSTKSYLSKFMLSAAPTPSTATSIVHPQTPAKTCSTFSDSPRRLPATLEVGFWCRNYGPLGWSGGRSHRSGSIAVVSNISTCQHHFQAPRVEVLIPIAIIVSAPKNQKTYREHLQPLMYPVLLPRANNIPATPALHEISFVHTKLARPISLSGMNRPSYVGLLVWIGKGS